ncbi:TPA: hypothetical protein JG832_002473 [Enterobacter hormaechei subsp. xiangfangensis]|nr:hypothetical protein [Enterobacter hormaechei subsp. xiangfangensis]HAV1890608.1 hypothetical protein [Enterobacter hormaechei subsp. xiangfangensis]
MSLMQDAGGLPPQIAAYINTICGLSYAQLQQVVKDEGLSGFQLSAVLDYFPAWFFRRKHEKNICQTVINYTHPRESGQCFASTERLIAVSNSNQTALERCFREVGTYFFKCCRRFNKPTVRTLTAAALRVILITRAIVRASLSERHTAILIERLICHAFKLTPPVNKSKKGEGMGRKKGEGLKEPQPPAKPKIKPQDPRVSGSGDKSGRSILEALAQAIRSFVMPKPKRRSVPEWKRQQRDINRIPEPDNRIPDGFRGAEPVQVPPPAPRITGKLTDDERRTIMIFLDTRIPLPSYLHRRCVDAGENQWLMEAMKKS